MVEHVALSVSLTHDDLRQVEIWLKSPLGTSYCVFDGSSATPSTAAFGLTHTLGVEGFRCETAFGEWTVELRDTLARRLLLDILDLGLPVATEFLDLLSPQFISDLVSWGAIGARTTESQSHRQLASGLSCPVGFKNGTDGGIKVASDAIQAAQAPHAFMGMTKMGQAAIFETRGNADCHVILRGGKAPNYSKADVDAACALLKAAGLREQVMIDVSHANSSKQHRRQIDVSADVAQQIAAGDARITGVMIESHLNEGRQDIVPGQPLQHGVSVTDACISFEQTVPVLQGLAEAVRARRSKTSR